MEPNHKEFALFIDGIRIERGLSREDLIEDIISLSQYKRYLRGVTAIPNNVVVQIADRLKYSINDFYTLFTKKHNSEYNDLLEIYSLIKSQKYQEALEECHNMKDELIVSSYNKLFYEYCFLFSQYMLGKISGVHLLNIFSDMVDYPNCFNNETYNMIEMNILTQIVRISSDMGNYEAADNFYETLTNPKFQFYYTGDFVILPIIYYYVARVFRNRGETEKAIKLSLEGVEAAISAETSNTLPHLYLLLSILIKDKDLDKASYYVKKCFLQLIILDKPALTEAFINSYKANFDIPLEELLKDVHKLI